MAKRGVVKILGNSATSFAACFYNGMKVARGEAKCISMRNFGPLQDYFIHSPVVMSRYLQKIADHNTLVKHPQKHMVWSLPGEATQKEQEQLLKNAQDTFDRLGYEGQPQAFWVHFDSKNFHIHGVTTTVSVNNGQWIDNYYEGRRARRILDQLRNVNVKSDVEKFLQYKFENREQFKSLLLSSGYRCHYDEGNKCFDIFTNHDTQNPELTASVTVDEIDARIVATGKNKDNHKERIKQLRGILLDRRRRSLELSFGDDPIRNETKAQRTHTVTKNLSEVKNGRFNGDKGIDLEGERKAQFKQFLMDLKKELGISIVFSKYQDGKTKGYTLIDHNKGIVFKGSDIVDLQKLLNPEWRKGQQKDAILSADDAADTADEIRTADNLPLTIKKQLEKLGIEVILSKEASMLQYGNDSEEENREKAVSLLDQVVKMVKSEDDATEEGAQQIKAYAKEALSRAIVADEQKVQKEHADVEEQEPELTESERVAQIIEKAKVLPVEVLAQYIIDTLDDYNIKYKVGAPFDIRGQSEDKTLENTFKALEKAITEEDISEKARYADYAVCFARAAEELHRINNNIQTNQHNKYEPDVQQERHTLMEPKQEKQIDGAMPRPFVKIEPSIGYDNGKYYIETVINGEEHAPKVMNSQHVQWYMRQQNQDQAAQTLALHYFADEIQKAQVDEWKNKHYENGKMPDGSKVMDVRATTDGMDYFEATGQIVKDGKSVIKSGRISRKDFVEIRNGSPADKDRIFCQTAGKKHLLDWGFAGMTEIKSALFGSEVAPQDSVEGLTQTVETFENFTEMLCNDFITACGNAALAYLGGLGGDGRGGAGGGGNNDLPRKKDNDDRKVHSGIMNAKPTKKGGIKK